MVLNVEPMLIFTVVLTPLGKMNLMAKPYVLFLTILLLIEVHFFPHKEDPFLYNHVMQNSGTKGLKNYALISLNALVVVRTVILLYLLLGQDILHTANNKNY